ncbi:ComF family protein [Filimonas zeae]|uniref:ComF family protein n=1 Tax=Filimonas zeae TaxID=1737353 RepID=UPI001665336B|nr:ComF family protein [Filimonas zeae]MDR6342246.1 ComF family protein [Filimonas zeae]
MEKLFYGRVPIAAAGSLYYFTRNSLLQRIIYQLKYRNHPPTGLWLGRLLGQQLKESKRFQHVTVILPVPLHPRKARQRGYNQSLIIAQGIAEVCGWEILDQVLHRTVFTATQTHRNRENRMLNLQQAFTADSNALGHHRHVLLIDDVITTGATLEACALALQQAASISVSIATVGCTPPR